MRGSLSVLALAALCAVPAHAAPASPFSPLTTPPAVADVPDYSPSAPASAPGAFSVLVEFDAEAGTWRLQPFRALEFQAPAEESLDRSFDGLHEEPLEGGGWRMDLGGRFMDHLVVRIDACGRVRLSCVDELASARAIVNAGPEACGEGPVER